MTDLDKARDVAVRGATFVDRFVEDHPRWSMAIAFAIWLGTVFAMWG